MADVSYSISGADQLAARLRRLGDDSATKLLRGTASAGAAVFRREAALRAPVYNGSDPRIRAGTLKQAIQQFYVKELSGPDRAVYRVKPLTGLRGQFKVRGGQAVSLDAFYWNWVERGHRLVKRTGKGGPSLRQRRKLRDAILDTVPPHPFMRPAFEAKRAAARERMIAYLREHFPKVVAQVR